MGGFKSLSIKELMLLAKFKNLDCYENMSRKQLENVFSTSHSLKRGPKPMKPGA